MRRSLTDILAERDARILEQNTLIERLLIILSILGLLASALLVRIVL